MNESIDSQRHYDATVLLSEGVTVKTVNQRLMHFKIPGDDAGKSRLQITTFYQYLLKGENLLPIILIPFIASLVLIVSLINFLTTITLETKRRQKKVAIRKINGAGARVILYMFGRLYLGLLVISAGISFPILYVVLLQISGNMVTTASVASVVYNPLFWIVIWIIVGLIVLLTIGWRLLGISRLNPAEVIKSE